MNEAQVTVDGKPPACRQPRFRDSHAQSCEHHGTYPCRNRSRPFLDAPQNGLSLDETKRKILRKRVGEILSISLDQIAMSDDRVTGPCRMPGQTSRGMDSSLHDLRAGDRSTARAKSEQSALGVSPRGSSCSSAPRSPCLPRWPRLCLPDDFKSSPFSVFSHRVVASSRHASLQKKSETTDSVLRDIVESVPFPCDRPAVNVQYHLATRDKATAPLCGLISSIDNCPHRPGGYSWRLYSGLLPPRK